MTCCCRPTPASESSSCTSSRRQGTPLIAYSESPLRNSTRVTVTSLNSTPRVPSELSMVIVTSARPRAGRDAVPAKMTSSIFWLRTALGAWAPSTQATASTTLDLPDPLGPTTTVTPGSSTIVVLSANDLNPLRLRLFRNTAAAKLPVGAPRHPHSRVQVEQFGHRCAELGRTERFSQHTCAWRKTVTQFHRRQTGDEEHRCRGRTVGERLRQSDAVEARHLDVGDQQIDRLFDQFEPGDTIAGFDGVEAEQCEFVGEHFTEIVVVVDEQHRRGTSSDTRSARVGRSLGVGSVPREPQRERGTDSRLALDHDLTAELRDGPVRGGEPESGTSSRRLGREVGIEHVAEIT